MLRSPSSAGSSSSRRTSRGTSSGDRAATDGETSVPRCYRRRRSCRRSRRTLVARRRRPLGLSPLARLRRRGTRRSRRRSAVGPPGESCTARVVIAGAAGEPEVVVELARVRLNCAGRARARSPRRGRGSRRPGACGCATGRARARSGRARTPRADRSARSGRRRTRGRPERHARQLGDASSGCATWCSVRREHARSNEKSSNGSAVASPSTNVTFAGASRRARSSSSGTRSTPTTSPTSGASASASVPAPVPESSARSSPAAATEPAQLLAHRSTCSRRVRRRARRWPRSVRVRRRRSAQPSTTVRRARRGSDSMPARARS